MLWRSLEASQWDASNEYPQHMFSARNEKVGDSIITLIWSYELVKLYTPWLDKDWSAHAPQRWILPYEMLMHMAKPPSKGASESAPRCIISRALAVRPHIDVAVVNSTMLVVLLAHL